MFTVLVYTGHGSSLESTRAISALLTDTLPKVLSKPVSVTSASTAADFAASLDKVDLVVFPGGFDCGFVKEFGPNGMESLKSYVRQGGCYLGVCAGAYFGCSDIEFEKGKPHLEVIGNRLGFFSGKAQGPAYPGFDYQSFSGASACNVICSEQTMPGHKPVPVYFNGGPVFLPNPCDNDSSSEVVATFADLPEGRNSAAVLCQYGKGRALLSSIHFEMSKPEFELASDLRLVKIYHRLKDSSLEREQFIHSLIHYFLNK